MRFVFVGSQVFAPLLPLGFIVMAGASLWARRTLGLSRPTFRWLAIAFSLGATLALLWGLIGLWIFEDTRADRHLLPPSDEWFGILFGAAAPHLHHAGALFSPAGEELFFRGFLQSRLEHRFSASLATAIDCALFGLVHLLHRRAHGLQRRDERLHLHGALVAR